MYGRVVIDIFLKDGSFSRNFCVIGYFCVISESNIGLSLFKNQIANILNIKIKDTRENHSIMLTIRW